MTAFTKSKMTNDQMTFLTTDTHVMAIRNMEPAWTKVTQGNSSLSTY